MKRILRAVLRPFKRLIRRIFWRHRWEYKANPHLVRKCEVCGQCQAVATDGYGGTWHTLIKGSRSNHYAGSAQ